MQCHFKLYFSICVHKCSFGFIVYVLFVDSVHVINVFRCHLFKRYVTLLYVTHITLLFYISKLGYLPIYCLYDGSFRMLCEFQRVLVRPPLRVTVLIEGIARRAILVQR